MPSNKAQYKEAPLGVGKMPEKSGPECAKRTGGSSGSEVKSWSMPKGDGTGSMKSESPDPGYDAKREGIGKTVPTSRHAKDPL